MKEHSANGHAGETDRICCFKLLDGRDQGSPRQRRIYLIARCFLFLSLVALFTGCQAARMALPRDFPAAIAPMDLAGFRGFGRTLRFGTYEAVNISRGWRTSSSLRLDVFGWSKSVRKSSFELVNTSSGIRTSVKCANNARWQDIKAHVLGGQLEWQFAGDVVYITVLERGAARWEMVMEQDPSGFVLSGRLSNGNKVFDVTGVRKLEGTTWDYMEASGYLFTMAGTYAGAVETLNNGRIWLEPGLDEEVKDVLSASAISLLLYQDLRK